MVLYVNRKMTVMIIHETYLSKIRPFIGKDVPKVLAGIHRGREKRSFKANS